MSLKKFLVLVMIGFSFINHAGAATPQTAATPPTFSLAIRYPEKTSAFEISKKADTAVKQEKLTLSIDGRTVKSRSLTQKDKDWLKTQLSQMDPKDHNRRGVCRTGELVVVDGFESQPKVLRTCIGSKDKTHKKITNLINTLYLFL